MTEDVIFYNNKNQKIAGRIYKPAAQSRGGVIFCHGFFSGKDAYKIVNMADDIVKAGFELLTFDFSFVGESGGDFKEFSILQEVEDLRSAVNYFQTRNIGAINLIGSSMGGTVSLLFASENLEVIKSLTLIATPIKMSELLNKINPALDISSISEDGMTYIEGVPVNNKFFIETSSIDTIKSVRTIRIPTLVIHGKKDAVVDFSNAKLIYELLQTEKKLVSIDDGEHNLTRSTDIRILKENIINWINS
jgi:uncharacterized protein